MSNKKDILEYNAKFSMIPKDYMERLAYLYRVMPYKKKDMEIRHLALPTSVRINESTLFRMHRKHLKSDAENLSSVNSKTLSNDKEKESCV